MKYAFLVSGNLGLVILKEVLNRKPIEFVFTDSNSTEIINFCELKGLPYFTGNPRKGKSKDFLLDKDVDFIFSVNYLFLIDYDIIKFPKFHCINFHGSLLPKYRGRTPHVWAIINNESFTGVTAHLIDNDCDTGDIIEQVKIPISSEDTGNSILKKFEEIYVELFFKVLENTDKNKIIHYPQDESKATFFGKRTPSDGQIDWSWSKERIYNWVRAQANPYPGAFTFEPSSNQKIIIDKISFSDHGFKNVTKNGTILKTIPLLVKTPNGVIEINKTRSKISLKQGTILK